MWIKYARAFPLNSVLFIRAAGAIFLPGATASCVSGLIRICAMVTCACERRAINGKRSATTYPSSVAEALGFTRRNDVTPAPLLEQHSETGSPWGPLWAARRSRDIFQCQPRQSLSASARTARFWNIKSVSTGVIPLISHPDISALQGFWSSLFCSLFHCWKTIWKRINMEQTFPLSCKSVLCYNCEFWILSLLVVVPVANI